MARRTALRTGDDGPPARWPAEQVEGSRGSSEKVGSSTLGLGDVIFRRIILHHPPGVELRDEGGHRAANLFNPGARDAIRVPIVKAGNNFLSKHAVQIFAVDAVLFFN